MANNLFENGRYRIIIPIVDLIIVYISIIGAFYFLRYSLDAFVDNYYAFIAISPYIGICYLLISNIFELEKPKDFSFFGVAYTVSLIIFILFCVTMAISFLAREFAYPRSVLLVSSLIQIAALTSWHLFVNKMYLNVNKKKKVLIVGYEKSKKLGYKLIESNGIWSAIQHICKPDNKNVWNYIDECDVTFLTDDIDENTKQNIVEYCVIKKRTVLYEPKNTEILLFNADFVQADDSPLLSVRYLGIKSGNETLKRCLDVFLGCLGGIVFIIPIIIIYIILKSTGKTAFFVQERVTRDGKIFKMYKFRTMVENAEAKSGPVLAAEGDKRITRLGRFMRTTRLDETPQIYNILKGDMSIVGPRPERPYFVEQFVKEIPEYNLRHRVKAGLTGLAQVQGKYNTTVEDKLKYDLLYINGYSIALDVKLIMQTLNILLRLSSTQGVKEGVNIDEQVKKLCRE